MVRKHDSGNQGSRSLLRGMPGAYRPARVEGLSRSSRPSRRRWAFGVAALAFVVSLPLVSPGRGQQVAAGDTTPAASSWRGPIRLPWYGAEWYGRPVSCPGYGKFTRWSVSVAVRDGDTRFKCGDRIELRSGKQRAVAVVTDRFASWAPDWVVFDASARLACHLLNPPRLKSRKPGKYHTCYTRDGVLWRRLPRG